MTITRYIISLCTVALAFSVSAVCLDPKTGVSGYRIPLNEEVSSTKSIAIGKITKKRPFSENLSNPELAIVHIYSVQVTRTLKGQLPKAINIRVEQDSGRYVMDVGEKHLFFLNQENDYFIVDSCGNSSPLPDGNAVLKQVETQLNQKSNKP